MRYTFYLYNDKVAEIFTRGGLNDACRLFGEYFFPHLGIGNYRRYLDTIGACYSGFIGFD